MLVFAAVVNDGPQNKEIIELDETIFYRIGAGDKEAFCELYAKTSNAIFSYALSILRNQQDAEDAMQETYLKIRSAAHLYQPEGKPMAWVFTIARNICLMKFRKKKHASVVSFEEMQETPDCSKIKDREDRIVLETAFRILTHEECQIIVLHAVTGLKHREISELLQLSLSTVLSKYNRGLKKLRKQLEEEL
ncbi:RNA polymerase sigma factor [Parablautia sp. Marseille-Q6255]|uniref:RNA polymerase sigma factor n=1 Tax=Parablautia sp. Marseille-Q6255 TaxID=3039593 RepID=UPI0024BC1E24|nr:RNA polymerase sigma factor [Parablautia sp. Marseille-Q6255]